MTTHLSPEQFVEAAEQTSVPPPVQAHLASCATCAARVGELRATVASLAHAADVPEPSPLFWDHFSSRVRAAIDADPPPAPAWWPRWWRPVVAMGAMAGAAALVVILRGPAPAPHDVRAVAEAAVASAESSVPGDASTRDALADDEPWNLIVAMAGMLPHEDVHDLVPPAHGAAGLVDDLTPEQRAAFVQLVKQQMGGTE